MRQSFHLIEMTLVWSGNEDMNRFDVVYILYPDWNLTRYCYIVILSLFCYYCLLRHLHINNKEANRQIKLNSNCFKYLKVVANDLELADGLELHGFTGQVLLRRDGVGEDVEEHGAAARRVHPERHDVVDDRLRRKDNFF